MTTIVITGCSTGIGLETAKYLQNKGINVYPTARDLKDVEMLKTLGFENAMQLDVTKYVQIKEVIEVVLDKFSTDISDLKHFFSLCKGKTPESIAVWSKAFFSQVAEKVKVGV